MNSSSRSPRHFISRFGTWGFFVGVLLTAFSMPLWNLGMSLGQFVMAGGWLLAGDLPRRLRCAARQPIWWGLLALFLIHLTGLWNTENSVYAFKDIRVKLPLLLMPLLFAAGPELTGKQLRIVFHALLAGVLTATLAGLAARLGWLATTVNGYRDLSLFISHIRLALLLDVSLVLALYLQAGHPSWPVRLLYFCYAAWCLCFLWLMQSLTGIALLALVLCAGTCAIVMHTKSKILRISSIVLLLLMAAGAWKAVDTIFIQSVKKVEVNRSELKTVTARGNPYKNDWKRHDTEQGRLVWMQYNDLELDTAWMTRSRQRVWESDKKGNMQLVTLMRYLTYKGYSHDAAGVAQLTNREVKQIEAGYPTPEYASEQENPLFRFKELAAEYRNYYYSGFSSGHTLAQRLEYWKTARWIIARHPLAGVGTGDVPDAFQQAYEERHSSLSKEWRLRAHNQYLSFAVAFGWPGILLLVAVLVACFSIALKRKDGVYLAFLLIAAGSFFNEDTLETQAGVTFFAFLNCLFLFREKPN